MLISLIAAVSKNGVIGKDGKLPWHLPADLKFFKKTTLGHPIIMGRKNAESIGRSLPGRTNIVLSRNPECKLYEDSILTNSFQNALEIAKGTGTDECFVIGGGEIYREMLPLCEKLYITTVYADFDGDVFMPEYTDKFQKIKSEMKNADKENPYQYEFSTWKKI